MCQTYCAWVRTTTDIDRETMNKSYTHLEISGGTDRHRVSSWVSTNGIRLRWAKTRLARLILQQLGNWRPHGHHICKGLKWHIHTKMHTALMPRKSCCNVKAEECFANIMCFWKWLDSHVLSAFYFSDQGPKCNMESCFYCCIHETFQNICRTASLTESDSAV